MRLRWFVGMWAAVLAVVGLTVVVYDRVEGFNGPDDQLVGGGTEPGGGATSTVAGAPAPGSTGSRHVEGTVTAVHLEGAVLVPRRVPAPLTLVSERGFGNGGELTGVEVGGRPSAVVWDGGRPFVLSAGPGLVLAPATVDLVPEGLRVALGGGVHALEPGEHRLETPVAVGQAGVATPYDALTFTAGPEARLAAAGDTALVLGPEASWRFVGPGRARLEGDLRLTDADGRRATGVVDLGSGAFDLELAPAPDGRWTVTGLVQPDAAGDLAEG